MHELNTSGAKNVAEKMEMGEDGSNLIDEKDLGKSILTLSEVEQTFETDSDLFNITLCDGETPEQRTVLLKKNNVEVDGQQKLIIMIRDVTDSIRLE